MADNPDSIAVSKYILYRKQPGGNYMPLTEIPGASIQNGIYTYYDKYLENNISYSYRAMAFDPSDQIIAISNESKI